MKRYLCILILAALSLVVLPKIALSQSCSEYVLLRNNAQYEILTYDSKDKLMSKVIYHVTNVKRNNGKAEATVKSKVYESNGKLNSEGEFTVSCEGDGAISMDMRSMMNPEMMGAFKNMEMSMQGDKIMYPGKLKVGQKLEDGSLTVTMKDKSSGKSMHTMNMRIVDRTVEGKESIKVPAGTYEAYKIKQTTEMENQAMGMKMPAMLMHSVEYYVPTIGMVRSESYRDGKLMTYSVLSKVQK